MKVERVPVFQFYNKIRNFLGDCDSKNNLRFDNVSVVTLRVLKLFLDITIVVDNNITDDYNIIISIA